MWQWQILIFNGGEQMADISSYITVIENASRGEEVRDSIVNALNAINNGIGSIPFPSASDSGKYLRVNTSGAWELATVPNAEEVSF